MHPPRAQLGLRTLLAAMAIAAVCFTLCTRSRDEFVLIAIVASGMLVFFTRRPDLTVQKPGQAIKIAIAHIRQVDRTFQPEKHVAQAYRRFGIAPWIVDFYASGSAFIIKRVKISGRGKIRSSTSFAEDDGITSLKESIPTFTLDRNGAIVEASFQYDY
jgi:hypothetical protein